MGLNNKEILEKAIQKAIDGGWSHSSMPGGQTLRVDIFDEGKK